MRVTKVFQFDSAHNLIAYNGKCEKLHGHTYKLEVTVFGKPDADGILIDFTQLKSIVNEYIINKLDHGYLNDILGFNTTCENILKWMWYQLDDKLHTDRYELYEIKLWETPASYAQISREDIN